MITIVDTNIEDVKIIEPKIYNDERGYFFESYNQKEFCNKIGKINFVQDNESKSTFGILRGMHYQAPPFEQSKLVRVICGEIQDIAVDLRKDSPDYLKYVSVILSSENKRQLFIPKGFAHGFLVLSKKAIVNYKVDNYYNNKSEKVIPFNDNAIKIKWSLNIKSIKLSKKDMAL
jgi:dTDP-4-dehydrorhamnose 3,5-epimerase